MPKIKKQETMSQRMKRIRDEANEANRRRSQKDLEGGLVDEQSQPKPPKKTVNGQGLTPKKKPKKGLIDTIRDRRRQEEEAAS